MKIDRQTRIEIHIYFLKRISNFFLVIKVSFSSIALIASTESLQVHVSIIICDIIEVTSIN